MLKTFPKGGVHPPENKYSAEKAIEKLAIPEIAYIPVAQHIGAPAKVLVKRGDVVKVGMKIAETAGFISANIHSPVSGTVNKIDKMVDASGYPREVVVIKVEGDEWEDGIDTTDTLVNDISADKAAIQKAVADAGIVGLGGATFPSHVKLMVPDGKKAEMLVINGVECEPYLTADHRLMLEKGEEILVGIEILKKAVGVTKAYIGIENNKKDAIEHLTKLAQNYSGTEIVPLKVQYPQGGEKQLIKAVTGKEVPSGALPIEVGAVVNNVGTAFAIYEAVQKNKPLVERVVTVTGKSVSNPSNFLTRIGTPASQLIEAAGGLPEDTGKVISGGPMMGKALASLDAPVTKGTSGLLIMQSLEAQRKKMKNCIRCAKCVSACPMGIEPYLLMTYSDKSMYEEAADYNIKDCIECGSCSYSCPADRPLLDYIRLGKSTVMQIERAKNQK